ncbi:hypothetical protein [Clostridium botulinum]|uniref:hypothetical protein n=1 Tax=Clostridium botulinum TaxID=1491 RepID=UPI000159213A|nr:hypothetical protein [Clostridium botulinum]ABS35858.1 conserved hypothetical protein [Clostridium botulinum A str. ATCC 19397]EDT84674.1 conserved hypothetical protein [Clostridium botulinum Bf]MBO3440834.1 hypothetical protein [Clostridium botulinum]NFH04099.1 hypothetical protein [Clostridium botulinum]NFM48271.1 hypothetical protein [Clostridium botulinum]
MNENWCTLAIAVLYERPCTIEQAFELLDKGKFAKNRKKSKEDLEDMVKLKEFLSLQEIAEIYGSSESSICQIINKFKNKKIAPCQEHNN